VVVRQGLFRKQIPAGLDPLNLESLSGPNVIALPQLDGQHDLTLAGDSGLHVSKIASYFAAVKTALAARGDQGGSGGSFAPFHPWMSLVKVCHSVRRFPFARASAGDCVVVTIELER
jgi:hypothetical protein